MVAKQWTADLFEAKLLFFVVFTKTLFAGVNESNDVLSRQQMNSDQIFNCVVFRWYKIS